MLRVAPDAIPSMTLEDCQYRVGYTAEPCALPLSEESENSRRWHWLAVRPRGCPLA